MEIRQHGARWLLDFSLTSDPAGTLMEATWVGGPWDGRTDELPEATHRVAVAVARKPEYWDESDLMPCPDYRELTLPVVHTANGVRIFWHEPQ
jgi:hypothetical protein